jgi:uncharacterized membrane protein YbhN (UPF0104 family)
MIPARDSRTVWRYIYFAATALLVLVVLLGYGGLRSSTHELLNARPLLVIIALITTALSFVAAAFSYWALALKAVPLRQFLVVQVASGFTGRLLPAGLGGAGLFGFFLTKRDHNAAEASAVVAANALFGITGDVSLMLAVLLLRPWYIHRLLGSLPYAKLVVVVLVIGVILLGIFIFVRHSQKLRRFFRRLHKLARAVHGTLSRPRAAAGALAANIILTIALAASLVLALSAVGAHASLLAAMVVLSAGTLTGAAVPVPGGLGGVEAGLVAGLVIFGVPSSSAVAAVLLYRGVTFWLPIIPGVIAFRYVQRRYL